MGACRCRNVQQGARNQSTDNCYLYPRVFAEHLCSDMTRRPTKVNKEEMHCHGLLKKSQSRNHPKKCKPQEVINT